MIKLLIRDARELEIAEWVVNELADQFSQDGGGDFEVPGFDGKYLSFAPTRETIGAVLNLVERVTDSDARHGAMLRVRANAGQRLGRRIRDAVGPIGLNTAIDRSGEDDDDFEAEEDEPG